MLSPEKATRGFPWILNLSLTLTSHIGGSLSRRNKSVKSIQRHLILAVALFLPNIPNGLPTFDEPILSLSMFYKSSLFIGPVFVALNYRCVFLCVSKPDHTFFC